MRLRHKRSEDYEYINKSSIFPSQTKSSKNSHIQHNTDTPKLKDSSLNKEVKTSSIIVLFGMYIGCYKVQAIVDT